MTGAGRPVPAEAPAGLPAGFAPALIAWQRREGRHGLPWQGTRDPYRVWLSEIMLQQTQVSTVLSYYPRFLARFPDVASLAAAPVDDVMALWSGLGYYSRARNLHRCAQAVMKDWAGAFPQRSADLATLPGIGASTAAAIASFCFGERVSILDGNVRRVLTRLLAFDRDLAQAGPQRELWELAQALVQPDAEADDMVAYTQGLMDLGATVCTRTRPSCALCPVQDLCEGRRSGDPTRFPVRTRRLNRRFEAWWLLLIERPSDDGHTEVWLHKRPERGIWAGLFCPPVFDSREALCAAVPSAMAELLHDGDAVAHALTHRELRLHPVSLQWPAQADAPGAAASGQWVRRDQMTQVGLPAPVRPWLAA
ncbi:A/G-specific adenine glycosylase [Hydrogenophaga sp. IBVHS2]|uniref:A/G-specific adenine glycosylase n=1 Tax=Hydrogenophaga sp. IBVHS2 TaxID=1985170 RepID=UPI000A2D54AC|nr:A/G-specific adenine glycosylase [Hydrogenophaga sp. IBVHS2]